MTEPPHVAVTGAAGYIGSRVVGVLQERHPDWRVTALDNFYRGDIEAIGDVTVQDVDIRHRERLEETLAGADVVLHLAAISGVDDCESQPDLAFEVNVQGTNNVAWFCRKHGAGLLFPFSMAVLGDPQEFPITVGNPRDPINWYGRTKAISEGAIEDFAAGAFPAHQFMISNLYGGHEVDGRTVSKSTVINFFVDRALDGQPLPVYDPGSQSRNFIHVKDVARAFLASCERLMRQRSAGDTGAEAYELASDEDPSVMEVAELVRRVTARERDFEPVIELVDNPRDSETLVSEFSVDTTKTTERLGWSPSHTIRGSISALVNHG